jgi:hypothetical protein
MINPRLVPRWEIPLMRARFKSKRTSKLRNSLYRSDPRCHWCGRLTVNSRPTDGQTFPEFLATIDHVRSRLASRTVEEHRATKNLVLSCLKCNVTRADRENDFVVRKWYDGWSEDKIKQALESGTAILTDADYA